MEDLPRLHLRMAKARAKSPKATSVQRKHLYSRLSFLYQAAATLSAQALESISKDSSTNPVQGSGRTTEKWSLDQRTDTDLSLGRVSSPDCSTSSLKEETSSLVQRSPVQRSPPNLPLSRLLLSHLHDVSLKSQIRLSSSVKRSVCKQCHIPLVPSVTSHARLENLSRKGTKPWADVLVIRCCCCGAERRFPTGSKPQPRKSDRKKSSERRDGNDARSAVEGLAT